MPSLRDILRPNPRRSQRAGNCKTACCRSPCIREAAHRHDGPFELGLPEMVVGVDEAWGDYLASTVDCLRGWFGDVTPGVCYSVVLDEDRGVVVWCYVVVVVVDENGCVLKEDGRRHLADYGSEVCSRERAILDSLDQL